MQRKPLTVIALIALNFSANAQTLLTAAGQNDISAVRLALTQGAEVDATDEYGQTALIYAVNGGARLAVIQILLEAGANVNAAAEGGWTALHYAARANSVPHIRQLLQAGAHARASNDSGRAPFLLVSEFSAAIWLTFAYLRPFSTVGTGALVYLLLLQPAWARWFSRLTARTPVLEQGQWHRVELWHDNQAAKYRARLLTVQPLFAFVVGVAAVFISSSLVSPAQELDFWEFYLPVALLIFVVFRHVRHRFAQNRSYLCASVPAHLRPLGAIINDLSNGWFFQVDADSHVRVGHQQVPDLLYRLVYSPAEVDLRKDERGQISDHFVAEQLNELRSNPSDEPSIRNILFAPKATASSFDNRVATRWGWVFCTDGGAVTQQLEAWHMTHLAEKLASDRGREVEEQALQQARQVLPEDWQLHLRYLMESEGADIDLLIRLPDGKCYNVDVKSHRGDPTNPQTADRWQETINQVHRQANEVHGQPVVWQPEAQRKKAVIEHAGVTFIAGDATVLRDVLLRRSDVSAADQSTEAASTTDSW